MSDLRPPHPAVTPLRVACRESPLAVAQFHEFAALLSGLRLEPVWLATLGDRDRSTSLLQGEAPADFFTRELDAAVRDGRADAALHSAKDLPWPLARDMAVWALGPRHDPADSLVSLKGWTLDSLPEGAAVGTSSPQRAAALQARRPDLRIVSIRGTIAERIALLERPAGPNGEPRPDAVVVARCALARLGLPLGEVLPFETHPLQSHLALTGRLDDRRRAAWFADLDVRRSWGRVTIAGGGPGRADQLTAIVRQRLEEADIIFHDALLEGLGLEAFRGEKVYVGKRSGVHEMTQEAIQRRLHEAALAGRRAVRLKGGDPLVFGRGSEEADYLDQRLVDWELFPGVSAAQSAAAFAGLPLTERGRARSCALAIGADPERPLWTGADTQAFYMAGNALPRLAAEAEAHGVGDLPLAAVQGAASPWQSVTVGHYSGAAGLPRAGTDTAPVLYLGGPTVDGRAGNGWYDRLPRVLHTGLEPGRALKSVHVPYISVRPRPAADFAPAEAALLDSALGGVPGAVGQADGPIDWLVFTSRITVERWFALLTDRNQDSRALAGLRIASIGRATSTALAAHGIRPDLQPAPADEHSQGLAALLAAAVRPGFAGQTRQAAPFRAGMGNSPGCPGPAGASAAGLARRETARPHLLLPRSSEGLRLLPELLDAAGFAVDELVLYHTVARTDDPGILPEQFDRIVFSSPSGVKAFRRFHPAIPDRVLVELRGPQCRAAFRELYPGHPDADAGFRPEADPIPEQGVSPA